MEHLLALADLRAGAELLPGDDGVGVGDLLPVDTDTALLDEPPRFAFGLGKPAADQQVHDVGPASGICSQHRHVVGMVDSSPSPENRARAADWAFSASSRPWTRLVSSKARISFFSLIRLSGQASISRMVSSGRKVSIRMHFITSASSTFRQYW